jgi:hypothetical protein
MDIVCVCFTFFLNHFLSKKIMPNSIKNKIDDLKLVNDSEIKPASVTNQITAAETGRIYDDTAGALDLVNTALDANDATNATQTSDIAALKTAKTATDATDATQNTDIAALKTAKTANDATDADQNTRINTNQSILMQVVSDSNLKADKGVVDPKLAALESARQANDITDATQTSDIAALKVIRKDAKAVFYVDKQYSTQAEMVAQDLAALKGVSNRPYATPYSAKKAAIAELAANPSSSVVIVIARGNSFTNADYISILHDVTVSMGGVNYISGAELAFHGITYVMYGATIQTPLMNAIFLAAQATNGFAVKKAVFCGGKFTDAGYNSSAQSNIYFFDIEEGAGSPSRHAGRMLSGDAGIKVFSCTTMNTGLLVGDKWYDAAQAGNSSATRDTLRYSCLKLISNPNDGFIANFSKISNKDVIVSIQQFQYKRHFLDFGHFSGVANDGTLGGIENSTVSLVVENAVTEAGYVYAIDGSNAFINATNNKNSRLNAELCDLGTITVPKFLWVYGIQESNLYRIKNGKVKIVNPTLSDTPFSLALSTSKMVLEGWEIESDVANTLITLSSGTLVLKNCKIIQNALGKNMFNIAAGANLVLENCQLVNADRVTPLTTGTGTVLSKNSTSNVAIGTALLHGILAISKWYDESYNVAEPSIVNAISGAMTSTPNPSNLGIMIENRILAFNASGMYNLSDNTQVEININSAVGVFTHLWMFGSVYTPSNLPKWGFVPAGYIAGA